MLATPARSHSMMHVSGSKFSRAVENMVAEIRGLPPDTSHSKLRDTRTAGDMVDQILRKYRVGMTTPEEAIREAWTEIVGAPNAEYCHPERIERNRTLVVAVSNPVVRQELLFHKAVVLQRIQAIPAAQHIKTVVFRAG